MNTDSNNKSVINGWAGFLNSPYSVFVISLAIGIFYIVTLHEGHNWGDDFAQYIHHAKNIVEGKPYLDTGFIPTSIANFVGPYAYPPVFPILLAPVYWLYGLDLEAMKLVGIFCFCLTLMLLPKIFGYRLNRLQQIAVIVMTGFNPALWESRNHILTDFTFLLFCYLSLLLMLQVVHSDHYQRSNTKQTIVTSCLIGIAMYLAYGTREIGIILPLVILTYELLSVRKITSISMISVSIFLILLFSQHWFLQGNLTPLEIQNKLRELTINGGPVAYSHLDFISIEPDRIFNRIKGYRWVFLNFWQLWPPGNNQAMGILISVISISTALMAFIGFCLMSWKKISVLEIFFAGYVAILLLFGAPPTLRYLFPLFPLTLYYCVLAYQWIFTFNRFKFKTGILVSYISITIILYGHAIYNHSHAATTEGVTHPNSYAAIANGITHPKAVEMFEFIRSNTSPSDTIIFRKPRVMALLTGRASASYLQQRKSRTAEVINRYFDAVGGDYYVDSNLGKPLTLSEPPTSRFSEVFRNAYFVIYRYEDNPARGRDQAASFTRDRQ